MGFYWISRNNIALHYISVAYHTYHDNYRICHTYHGVYSICFQWPTNVPSCFVRFYSVVILSTVNTWGVGVFLGWRDAKSDKRNFFLTLPILWIDCGCWYLILPLIYLYLRITEMVGPFCPISWQKLTDHGKLGLNQYLSYKKSTMTTNQEIEKDRYVCLTSWNRKKNTGGSEQW